MPAATRAGVALLTCGVAAVGGAYAGAIAMGGSPVWAPWLLAIGGSIASVALFVLGAATRGVWSPRIGLLLGALLVTLIASFGAGLALTVGTPAAEPLFFGLPRRLGIVLYGVGVLPLLVLPLAHARSFNGRDAGSEGPSGHGPPAGQRQSGSTTAKGGTA